MASGEILKGEDMDRSDLISRIHAESIKVLKKSLSAHRESQHLSFTSYVNKCQHLLAENIKGRKIVYLDTMAWKCLSDFKRGKELRPEMEAFCREMTAPETPNKFVFPIGLHTMFELQSMDDPLTVSSLTEIIDFYSDNLCFASEFEILKEDIAGFDAREKISKESRPLILRRPFELYGMPDFSLNNLPTEVDGNTLQKAFYDVMCALPLSEQLILTSAEGTEKWDNNKGISDSNENKELYQVGHIKMAYLAELMGIMSNIIPGQKEGLMYVTSLIEHWNNFPRSTHFSYARIGSWLHALLRFDKNRPYRKGDLSDFSTAALALSQADAFFTDQRLYHIIHDTRLPFKEFVSCETLCGFDNFSAYLRRS